MTTTARQATTRIATDTAALFDLVILGADFDTCELCGHPAAELYLRVDNRDGAEVSACEHCADHADVSYGDDYDL